MTSREARMASAAIRDLDQPTGPDDRRLRRRVTTAGLRFSCHSAFVVDGLPAEIVDLSMTGARMTVEHADPFALGATVRVGLDGGAGTGVIRRIEASGDHETTYGIEFLWLDQDLDERIHDLVTGDRAGRDQGWRHLR